MKDRKKRFPGFPKFNLKSLKTQWVLSCISLSLIPLIIGVVIFLSNTRNFREQTLRNNEALLVQIHDMMDQSFRDVKAIMEKLTEDPSIPVFYSQSREQELLSHKLKLRDTLAQYCAYHSYISDIYVYFPQRYQLITSSTVAAPEILYHINHFNYDDDAVSYERWISILEQPHSGSVLLLSSSTEKTAIAYLKSLPIFSDQVSANIVIVLNTETIATMAKNVSGQSTCEFNILYEDHLVLPPGPLLSSDPSMAENTVSAVSGISRIAGNGKQILSALPSDIMEFTYLLVTPPNAYQTPIRSVNHLFLVGFLMVICGSIGFTIHFVGKNYGPIQEIVKIAAGGAPQPPSGVPLDEYTVIKKALNDSHTSSANMQRQLSQQNQQLMETGLTMLLHRYPLWEEQLSALNKLLDYPHLVLLIFCQDSVGAEEEAGGFSPEQFEQLSSWLQRDGGLLGKEELFCWLTRLDRHFLLILGLSQNQWENWDSFYPALLEDTAALAKIRARLYPRKIVVYPSPFCTKVGQLPDAWEEALYAMRYRMLFGIDYAAGIRISPPPGATGYYYPPEEETKLLNLIRSGDKEKASAAFEEIWQLNLEHDPADGGFTRCLLFDVTGTLLRACCLITPLSPINTTIRDTMKKLSCEKSLAGIHRLVLAFLGEICSIYSREHSKSTDKLKKEIFSYIGEHYQNPDLSVELIGDVFGKSRAYLFSLFKEDTGFSMLYHINRIRIDKAKELLLDKSLPIQDIASQVGFNSSINFTRAFKKYEGITPSKYRELHT